ncbi:hypothetical protein [Streptomyces sp. NPDC006551]|uniref:hypothetical protein n=1 Tax=Streptomyces sp. NPDC006551 TaxID=3157178 RepID=UPI0033B142B8
MAAQKRIVALTALLSALCGSASTAGVVVAMSGNGTVSVEAHRAEPQTREDYLRLWEAALAKSGKQLPANVDRMTDREIFEAMWSEWRKYAVLEKQPTGPAG